MGLPFICNSTISQAELPYWKENRLKNWFIYFSILATISAHAGEPSCCDRSRTVIAQTVTIYALMSSITRAIAGPYYLTANEQCEARLQYLNSTLPANESLALSRQLVPQMQRMQRDGEIGTDALWNAAVFTEFAVFAAVIAGGFSKLSLPAGGSLPSRMITGCMNRFPLPEKIKASLLPLVLAFTALFWVGQGLAYDLGAFQPFSVGVLSSYEDSPAAAFSPYQVIVSNLATGAKFRLGPFVLCSPIASILVSDQIKAMLQRVPCCRHHRIADGENAEGDPEMGGPEVHPNAFAG